MKIFSTLRRWVGDLWEARQKYYAVPNNRGWFNIINEAFGGAWQQGQMSLDSTKDLLAYSAIFAPLTLIASDVAKLRIRLMETDSKGIESEVTSNNAWLPVLRKPNKYQNRIKFVEQWIVSKLLYGNTYVLKVRDARGVVSALYILDATRVSTVVADNGDVYYQLKSDNLSGLEKEVTVPATEIIHDMMTSLWHPLCGVSPIYAAAMSATQGRRIQNNSSKFFENMSRPSGILSAPGLISDETANRLKQDFETNFGGSNIGRLAVVGDDLKYQSMVIPAEESQLIEQLEWTSKDIAAAFHMPLFKVGGPVPANHTIEALNLQYYQDCLQILIESLEACLDEGLALPHKYKTKLDIESLARMDTAAQIETLNKSVAGGWMAPNEARKIRNLKPVPGGDSPMIQQQNYSLGALAKRDAKEDPFATEKPAAPALPAPAANQEPAAKPAEESEEDKKEIAALYTRALLHEIRKNAFIQGATK